MFGFKQNFQPQSQFGEQALPPQNLPHYTNFHDPHYPFCLRLILFIPHLHKSICKSLQSQKQLELIINYYYAHYYLRFFVFINGDKNISFNWR